MKNRTVISVVAVIGAFVVLPAQAQNTAKLTDALPKCTLDAPKLRDCRVPDRRTYLELTVNRPDWRTQPNAWREFQEFDRIERIQQGN